MRTDASGYEITAAGASAVDAYDDAVRSLLLMADGVADAWEATVAGDPGFTMGHVGRAYLRCLSSEGPDAAAAREILRGVDPGGTALTDRERRHVGAALAYASGDLHAASERLAALSVEYPRDALALSVGHQLDFFRGDAVGLRDRIGRVVLAWDPGHPYFGFVLGMQAFGLEECHLYAAAEAAGHRALEYEPRDVWAFHAVVHVHEMQARAEAGLRFMDQRRDDWTKGNFFVVHNAWHEALFRLEVGDIDGALRIYDETIHHAGSAAVALELLDASALLWRLHLDGADLGDRWTPLADAWASTDPEPWYVFNDVHAVMAYAGAGRLAEVRAVIARVERYVDEAPPVANAAMTAEVGLPVCRALLAFAEARYGQAVDALIPIRSIVHRFGGSNAQRDAVARTLLESAFRAGDLPLARALVSERLALKEGSPYNRHQLARLASASAGGT